MKKKAKKNRKNELKKGIYILPNFFTSLGLFFGFFSIANSLNGEFNKAAIGIFLASIFDALDGTTARITKSTSKFGVQYDSLSDLVSFGMAPALLAYLWALRPYGRLGWLGAFLFVACAALRLARFNIQFNSVEKTTFRGLPTPGAAYIIASSVMIFKDLGIEPNPWMHICLVVLMYLVSFVMVSNIKYPSLKDLGLFKRKPFITMFLVVVIIALIAAEPWKFMFCFSYGYFFAGILLSIGRIFVKKKSEEGVIIPASGEGKR